MNKNRIEYFFFSLFAKLFKLIGLNATRKLGKFLGSVVFYLVPIRKKVVLQNLTRAFPTKSNHEIKKIALYNYQSITITFFEFMYFPSATKQEMKSIIDITLTDECKEIVVEKIGFMFLTAHFGNWELSALSFPLMYDFIFHILAQPQRNPYVTKWSTDAREAFGNKVIMVGVSVRHIIEALKKNGVVGLAGDQRGPVDSPRIDFLGVPTAYHLGTPTIILKTKSKVLVGFAIRQTDYNYKMNVEKLDLTNLIGSQKEQIIEIQNRYIRILEKYVREYPEQYFWMHKIWKY